VLATSRVPLRVRGEQEYPLPTLEVPGTSTPAALLADASALRLFLERARAVRPNLVVDDTVIDAVTEICRRLDGLPLAIELAAAQSRLLPPAILLGRLEQRSPVLVAAARDLPERQRTLSDAIAWSVDLLRASEQRLFARLGAFAGTFSLSAAEAVCSISDEPRRELFEGIASLADHSLLVPAAPTADEPRFRMLHTIRDHALAQLVDVGEDGMLSARHLNYYAVLADEAEPSLNGPDPAAWLERLQPDADNLRAALAWGAEHDRSAALRMAVALWRVWSIRGQVQEGLCWLEALLPEVPRPPSALLAKGLNAAGTLAVRAGALDRAIPLLEQSRAVFRELLDDGGQAAACEHLAWGYEDQGNLDGAYALYKEALELARSVEDSFRMSAALNGMAGLAMRRNDVRLAERHLGDGLTLARNANDQMGIATCLSNLGSVAIDASHYNDAHRFLNEALDLFDQLADVENIAVTVYGLARLAEAESDWLRAARLFGGVRAQKEAIGVAPDPSDDSAGRQAAAELGEEAYKAASAAGGELSLKALIDEARSALTGAPASGA